MRKDNAYFSFDWRIQRPITFGADGRFAGMITEDLGDFGKPRALE